MGFHIVSVNISECTDCFLVSRIHHAHFSGVAGDNEKGRKSINDRLHHIYDVGGIHFSLEFTDIFGRLCFERADRHLNTRCQAICLPLHPVGCGSVRRTLRSANDQALYLCCITVIKPLQFKGFSMLIPMDALMHDGIIDRAQVSQEKSLWIDNDGLCRKVSDFHFSSIGVEYFGIAILKENLPKYRKVLCQFLGNNRKTEPVSKNHRVNRHRSSQGFRVVFPQKFRSYLIKVDFIADGNERIRQRLVLLVSLTILLDPMNTEVIHISG